jgi:hypothetical protein
MRKKVLISGAFRHGRQGKTGKAIKQCNRERKRERKKWQANNLALKVQRENELVDGEIIRRVRQ